MAAHRGVSIREKEEEKRQGNGKRLTLSEQISFRKKEGGKNAYTL
jgi:hypothetical protein